MKRSIKSISIFVLPWIAALLVLTQCAQENVLTIDDGTLSIDSISPTEGVVGSQLRIYGKGFSSVATENTVMINGTEVSVEVSSVSSILVTIPQQVTTGPVVVMRESQSAQGPVFTITSPPNIVSLQPAQGFAGDQIVIAGSNLDHVQGVFFNGAESEVLSRTNTELQVVVPESSTGVVSVAYNGGEVAGPVFTYLQIPLIEDVELTFGRPSYLHITGRHFNQNPSTLKVYLSGAEVPIIDQMLNPEPSHLLIAVPDPGGPNPVQVVVESNGKQSLPYNFTMIPNMFTFNFEQRSISGNNITYDFQIEGEYFGGYDENRSVELRHTGTGQIINTTIQSWDPNFITGEFIIDPATLGNDALAVSVIVAEVRSAEIIFRP